MKPEDKTQSAILEWLELAHPEARQYVVKIDNEGKRSFAGHAIAKKCGLHKYASDIFIAWPTSEYYGLWLEIKPDGWKRPRNQEEHIRVEGQLGFGAKMRLRGYQFAFVSGVDQGIEALKNYLKIKHAH